MRRLELLDGLRGYFLVFMLLNHLSFTGGYLLVKVNHGELGFVQDAQGFVFLSGLLIGMVYARRMARQGFGAGAAAIWNRSAELYAYALGCILVVLAAAAVLPGAQRVWEPWLGRELAWGDGWFLAAAAAMIYQPTYMDILPQYIIYLILAPPLVWLCMTGRWAWVAAGCAVSWFIVQLGLHLPVAGAINAGLGAMHDGLTLRAHFNVLAWQVIFMGGLVLGVLTAKGDIDWKRVFDPHRPGLAVIAAAFVFVFLVWRLTAANVPLSAEIWDRFHVHGNRGEFALIFLLNFVALGYLVAWLLMAGPQAATGWVRRVGRFMNGLFSLSFLRLLGRHSLQVYAWHVLLVYLLKVVDHHFGPFNELTKTAIALGAVALLAVPALWREGGWRALISGGVEDGTAKGAGAR